jgi:LmbE family N-acetylglucosaminyl deacetylase
MSLVVLALLLPPLAFLAIVAASSLRRPHVMTDEARDALILAAHPDDCVILAGAYAVFAREAKRRVRVAYLTCGAPAPDVPRAETRRKEALAVWASLGIPTEDVTFLDLAEHPVSGESTWKEEETTAAGAAIEGLLRAMPAGGIVFLPAAGELHVDHRGLRRLALEAWSRSGRTDLQVMEGPEYNNYLSLLQSPEKVWYTLALGVPGVSSRVQPRRPPWTGFAEGGPYWTLPANEERQARRRALLRMFASENGDLLVHLFGTFERYRPLKSPEQGLAAEPPRGYVMLGGRQRGPSAILALVVVAEAVLVLTGLSSWVVLQSSGDGIVGLVFVVGLVVWAAVFGLRRRLMPDSRILYAALALGGVVAIIAAQ